MTALSLLGWMILAVVGILDEPKVATLPIIYMLSLVLLAVVFLLPKPKRTHESVRVATPSYSDEEFEDHRLRQRQLCEEMDRGLERKKSEAIVQRMQETERQRDTEQRRRLEEERGRREKEKREAESERMRQLQREKDVERRRESEKRRNAESERSRQASDRHRKLSRGYTVTSSSPGLERAKAGGSNTLNGAILIADSVARRPGVKSVIVSDPDGNTVYTA